MTRWLCVLGHVVSHGCTGRLRMRGHLGEQFSIERVAGAMEGIQDVLVVRMGRGCVIRIIRIIRTIRSIRGQEGLAGWVG